MITFIALAFFFLIQMAVQYYEKKAQGALSNEEKGRMSDAFSKVVTRQLLPTIVLMLFFGVLLYFISTLSFSHCTVNTSQNCRGYILNADQETGPQPRSW